MAPVAAFGNVESVYLREVDWLGVTEKDCCFSRLLVPDVGDALEEQQREDVRLPVGPVHGAAAEDLGAFPEVRFQVLGHQGSDYQTTVAARRAQVPVLPYRTATAVGSRSIAVGRKRDTGDRSRPE